MRAKEMAVEQELEEIGCCVERELEESGASRSPFLPICALQRRRAPPYPFLCNEKKRTAFFF
jgi:hypothetical protein